MESTVIGYDENLENFEVNAPYLIYQGEFILKKGEHELILVGEIFFNWLPDSHLSFRAEAQSELDPISVINITMLIGVTTLNINDQEIGTCINITQHSELNGLFEGKLNKYKILGDSSREVEKVSFYVPNLSYISGIPVVWPGKSAGLQRLIFTNQEYSIIIEQNSKFFVNKPKLEKAYGYCIQYYGEVRKNDDGLISYDESKKLLSCLSHFLSFINGRRTSALFAKGEINDNQIWSDFGRYHVDPYKYVTTWYHDRLNINLAEMWKRFFSYWYDDDQQYSLRTSIAWYLDANSNKIHVEGSIVLAQAALELLYFWLVPQSNDNGNTESKILDLLLEIKQSETIPSELQSLTDLTNSVLRNKKSNSYTIDNGPKTILEIRNAMTHGNKWRQDNLKEISTLARIDTYILALWYVELSLLFKLGHNGEYNNRSISIHKKEPAIEDVPWIL